MHNTTGMYSKGILPWHYEEHPEDITITDRFPKDVDEFLEWTRTNWEVIQQPVFTADAAGSVEQIATTWANVKMPGGNVLGIVGEQYTVVQNRVTAGLGFQLIQAIAEDRGRKILDASLREGLPFQTGGELKDGKIVWYLIELGTPLVISEGVGEQLVPYLLVFNRHDAAGGLSGKLTTVRVECNNTLDMAIGQSLGEFNFRHTESIEDQIEEARTKLLSVSEQKAEFQKRMQNLLNTPFDARQMQKVLTTIYPVDLEGTDADKRRLMERRELGMISWQEANDLENIRNTAYGAIQGVTRFVDHVRKYRTGETRMLQLMTPWGMAPRFKARAIQVVEEVAGVN